MEETILLATDGSESAAVATEHALEYAGGTDAHLLALAVVETRTAYDNAIVDPQEVRDRLRADAEKALERVKRRADDRDTPVEISIEEGIPAREILGRAEDTDVDLIVLGARGRSAFKTVLLGSTAEEVLAEAPVPVAVVGGRSTGTD